jgi:ankyrin repeat protein
MGDPDGNTALHIAAQQDNHKAIDLILKTIPDFPLDSRNNKKETALSVAFHAGHCKLDQIFFQKISFF